MSAKKPKEKKFTFVDLFAGAGGFSEGFLQAEFDGASFDFVGASDLNENCELTHYMRYDVQLGMSVPFITEDISSDDFLEQIAEILPRNSGGRPEVDVICGGPPCQSFSLAGRRRNHDKKDDLFSAYLRVIDLVRPRYFVMENVKGILTKSGGTVKKRILDEIRSLVDETRLGPVIDLAGRLDPDVASEEEAGSGRLGALKRRLQDIKNAGAGVPLGQTRHAEKLFDQIVRSSFAYKASKTDQNILTARHGLRMLRRWDQLESLARLVKREKSFSDIDNDAIAPIFDQFIETITVEGIIEKVELALEGLSPGDGSDQDDLDRFTQGKEALRIELDVFGQTVNQVFDELLELAKSPELKDEMAALIEGARLYRIEDPLLLDAREFGVPQARLRVIFIGCRQDQPFIGEVQPTVPRPEDQVTVYEALADLDNVRAGESQTTYTKNTLEPESERRSRAGLERSRKVSGEPDSGASARTYAQWSQKGRLRSDPREGRPSARRHPYVNSSSVRDDEDRYQMARLHNHEVSRHRASVVRRMQLIQEAGGFVNSKRAQSKLQRRLKEEGLATDKRNYSVLKLDDVAPTMLTIPDDFIHYREPRALTVREMARLQSFDDDFVFQGKRTTGGERRKDEIPQYTLIGNAVPPLLARGIAATLLRHLAQGDEE